jgi:NADH dehydrogenase
MDVIKRNILVTGAGGTLGAALLSQMNARGWSVRALVLPGGPTQIPGAEVVFGDVRSQESLEKALEGVETVLHMAGVILSPDPQIYQDVNVFGTRNIINACKVTGVARLIFVSSVSVDYATKNAYSQSKADAEEFVRQSGLCWTIVRPTLLVGPGGGAEYKLFGLLSGFPLVVLPAGGRAKKRPVHVDDLAVGLCQLLECSGGCEERVYSLGGADSLTLREMLSEIAREKGLRNPCVLSLPAPLAKMTARLLDVFPHRFSYSQAMQGLLNDANPPMDSAQRDFSYAPQSLKGRW